MPMQNRSETPSKPLTLIKQSYINKFNDATFAWVTTTITPSHSKAVNNADLIITVLHIIMSTASEFQNPSSRENSRSNPHNNKPLVMDHSAHSYIAITFASNSPFFSAPASLTALHPALTYEGQVGALDDTHLFSVPKGEGDSALHERDDVLGVLEERGSAAGLIHVELQRPQQRARRDEL